MARRYSVYDCGKAAHCRNFALDPSWDTHSFPTFKEAENYANKYLGEFAVGKMKPNTPVDYGYGHMIEIRIEETID